MTVTRIAAGGAGVANLPDGRVVFIHRTAPGDRARIRIERSKPRWAVGSLCEVIEPGPERREGLCAHYDVCGGCQLQHLPYQRQLEWKARFVADALERIGKLADIEPPPIVASPEETGYRDRITFTLRRARGGHVVAGFHALRHPGRVVDVVNECVLPRASLAEAWLALRAGWGEGACRLPSGGRLRLTLREGLTGVALVVDGGAAGWSDAELLRAVPELSAIWHRSSEADSGPGLVAGSVRGRPPPGFVQINSEVAALLVDHVTKVAGPGGRAVDAYCGSGDYGRALTARGWRVRGIERDAGACVAARSDAPDAFSVVEGLVERRLGEMLPADLLIVNPPRAGLAPEVARLILGGDVGRVIYVSCDPATLARDVGRLSGRYRMASLMCFDLFPQTAHVETVLVMTSSRVA